MLTARGTPPRDGAGVPARRARWATSASSCSTASRSAPSCASRAPTISARTSTSAAAWSPPSSRARELAMVAAIGAAPARRRARLRRARRHRRAPHRGERDEPDRHPAARPVSRSRSPEDKVIAWIEATRRDELVSGKLGPAARGGHRRGAWSHMAQKAEASRVCICTARGATQAPEPSRISRVTIQARTLMLCREHAGTSRFTCRRRGTICGRSSRAPPTVARPSRAGRNTTTGACFRRAPRGGEVVRSAAGATAIS